MNSLKGKKILLAVSGSIAAYKTPHLVRLLVKEGANVKVILTEAAASLVSPLTLSTVSKNPVLQSISSNDAWNNHVELGYWADVMLIAPLSANTLAQLANGHCSNLLHAVYLSAKCPVVFAPAMDEDMWQHSTVMRNLATLQSLPNHIYIPVAHGELASGLVGAGRMEEPENIVNYLHSFFDEGSAKENNRPRAIVTAGPTYEKMDPVRFIGNFSSGKMGIALARALVKKGYRVELITGPGVMELQEHGIHQHKIISALELQEKVLTYFTTSEITIMAAAVADFRPEVQAEEKIKKGGEETLQLRLVKNPDILQDLGNKKKADQLLIGFALETQNELENAQLKLKKKNADYILLNSMQQEESVFGSDRNAITLLSKEGLVKVFPSDTKAKIAEKLVTFILENEK